MRQEGLFVPDEVVIANGGTVSGSMQFGPFAQAGFILPAAFTGTSISFQVSQDNVTFKALYSVANALIAVTVTQDRAYAFPLDLFPFAWVKLVSNGAEGAERTIQICSKY